MNLLMCVLSILGFLSPINAILSGNMISEFSKSKNLTAGVIFSCLNQRAKVSVLKELIVVNLRFIFANIENPSALDSFHHLNTHVAVILDGNCKNIFPLIEQSGRDKYFFETFHWLVIMENKENIQKILGNANININCNIHVAVPTKENNWTIFNVYNPAAKKGGELIVNELGYYNSDDGYNARINENKYWSRRNMSGIHFKSAVVIPQLDNSLKAYLESDDNRQMNSMNRFQYVAVNHCRDLFNFSLRVRRTNSWGYIQADGHFDGLVSLLERRVIDFGSSPLIFKRERLPVLDYGYGNWILRSTFIYRRPKVTANSYAIFLRPLDKYVWVLITIFLILIIISLRVVFAKEINFLKIVPDAVEASWSFLVLFTLGAFCQQGGICQPKLFSSRIISIFVFLFCILIYQFYSASIVSYLLMDPPRTIFNLKDLLDSQLRVGIEDILIDRNYFVQTTDPNAIKLYEVKVKGATNDTGFYSPTEGLDLVRKGGFAFHVETSTAYPIIEETYLNEEICELEEVQMYRTQPMHTNLQKHSPFKEMMNFCMLKLVENGNMDRLRKHWDARKPKCMESAKKTEIHVSLGEFSCGLDALVFGIISSFTFVLFEWLFFHRERLLNILTSSKTPVFHFTN